MACDELEHDHLAAELAAVCVERNHASNQADTYQSMVTQLRHRAEVAESQLTLDTPLAEAARAYAKLELVGPGPNGHDARGFSNQYVRAQVRIVEIYREQLTPEERAKLPTPPFAQAEFSRMDDNQLNTIDHLNRDAPLAAEARAHFERMKATCGCGVCEYIKKKENDNGK